MKYNRPQYMVVENERVDLAKSVANYTLLVQKYIAEREGEAGLVSRCLTTLFDQNLGVRMNQDYIVSQIVPMMGAINTTFNYPGVFYQLKKRILEVLKEEIEAGIYANNKGPGGGTYRVADLAASTK